MIILAFVLLLLLGAIAVVVAQQFRLRFGLTWLIAFAASALAWGGMTWTAWQLPISMRFEVWAATPGLFGGADWFVLDRINWPLGFALVSIGFAAVMSSLVRTPPVTPGNLAGILALTGIGLAAVSASSITALLFAWTALDTYELVLQLANTRERQISERVVISFSGHLMGTVLVLLSVGLSRLESFELVALPAQSNLIIVLAAAFRLGVLPIQPPILPVLVPKHGIQTVMRLAPVAGTMAVMARAAGIGVPESWKTPLLFVVIAAGAYGGLNWMKSRDDTAGRPYWIISLAALGVAGVIFQSPESVIAWGTGLVIGGGLLFLRTKKGHKLLWLYALTVALMSGLPFTPSWAVGDLIARQVWPWGFFILFLEILLLGGYLKHSAHQEPGDEKYVVGVYSFYIAALSLGFASMVFIGLIPVVLEPAPVWPWWPGAAVIAGVSLSAILKRVQLGLQAPIWLTGFVQKFSLHFFYRMLWRGYYLTGKGVSFFSSVLEGQSALLWAILLLAFLIAIFSQLGIGA